MLGYHNKKRQRRDFSYGAHFRTLYEVVFIRKISNRKLKTSIIGFKFHDIQITKNLIQRTHMKNCFFISSFTRQYRMSTGKCVPMDAHTLYRALVKVS